MSTLSNLFTGATQSLSSAGGLASRRDAQAIDLARLGLQQESQLLAENRFREQQRVNKEAEAAAQRLEDRQERNLAIQELSASSAEVDQQFKFQQEFFSRLRDQTTNLGFTNPNGKFNQQEFQSALDYTGTDPEALLLKESAKTLAAAYANATPGFMRRGDFVSSLNPVLNEDGSETGRYVLEVTTPDGLGVVTDQAGTGPDESVIQLTNAEIAFNVAKKFDSSFGNLSKEDREANLTQAAQAEVINAETENLENITNAMVAELQEGIQAEFKALGMSEEQYVEMSRALNEQVLSSPNPVRTLLEIGEDLPFFKKSKLPETAEKIATAVDDKNKQTGEQTEQPSEQTEQNPNGLEVIEEENLPDDLKETATDVSGFLLDSASDVVKWANENPADAVSVGLMLVPGLGWIGAGAVRAGLGAVRGIQGINAAYKAGKFAKFKKYNPLNLISKPGAGRTIPLKANVNGKQVTVGVRNVGREFSVPKTAAAIGATSLAVRKATEGGDAVEEPAAMVSEEDEGAIAKELEQITPEDTAEDIEEKIIGSPSFEAFVRDSEAIQRFQTKLNNLGVERLEDVAILNRRDRALAYAMLSRYVPETQRPTIRDQINNIMQTGRVDADRGDLAAEQNVSTDNSLAHAEYMRKIITDRLKVTDTLNKRIDDFGGIASGIGEDLSDALDETVTILGDEDLKPKAQIREMSFILRRLNTAKRGDIPRQGASPEEIEKNKDIYNIEDQYADTSNHVIGSILTVMADSGIGGRRGIKPYLDEFFNRSVGGQPSLGDNRFRRVGDTIFILSANGEDQGKGIKLSKIREISPSAAAAIEANLPKENKG